MMTSKTRGLLAFLVLSGVLAGCGAQDKPLRPGSPVDEPTATIAPSPSPSPQQSAVPADKPTETAAPVKQTVEASIYLADDQLLDTVETKVTLEYGSEAELLHHAVAALQKDASDKVFSLWKDIEIVSLQMTEGVITLDIHIPDEARLGAPGELLLVETLQKTLFQFEFVKAIDILVDGKATESLMGHVILDHPIRREA